LELSNNQCQQDHHGLRTQKEDLLTEVQGIISMSKNLDTHLNKLHSEIQRQQELLYNADYQIQLLERKVARRMGEKTLEETDFLKEVIREKEEETAKVREKYQATVNALKTLDDEQRIVEKKLKNLNQEKTKYQTGMDKINLENDMTREQLATLDKKKKNLMVTNDAMKLEINKLREKVLAENEQILELENR
jgi:chromosome segregation ATPase